MATPTRSPILGYNHNLKYRGRVFHVQTEDSGPGHPRIFTHLYFGGSIVASKKHEYDAEAPSDIVRGLMQSQHKSILRDLKNGRHDAQLEQFFAKRGEKLDAPDDSAELAASPPDTRPEMAAAIATATVAATATPPPVTIGAVSKETPSPARHTDSVSPEVLAQFEHAFDDDPSVVSAKIDGQDSQFSRDGKAKTDKTGATPTANQPAAGSAPIAAPQGGRVQPTIPVRPIPAPPPASSVKVERTVPVGQASPASVTPPPLRQRRPGHSIPYVVQQGSHPVAPGEGDQEVHVPTLTMPAAPIIPRVRRSTEPGIVAKAEAARAEAIARPVVAAVINAPTTASSATTEGPPPSAAEGDTGKSDRMAAAVTPPAPPLPMSPAAPLDPAAVPQSAPITAANIGALPTEVVSREDNQSLDEVIMAYLARGVEDEQKNVGS